MLSVEILEAMSGCKVTRPPEVAALANAAMNAAEELHPLMAGENIVRGVVSFLDFNRVIIGSPTRPAWRSTAAAGSRSLRTRPSRRT